MIKNAICGLVLGVLLIAVSAIGFIAMIKSPMGFESVMTIGLLFTLALGVGFFYYGCSMLSGALVEYYDNKHKTDLDRLREKYPQASDKMLIEILAEMKKKEAFRNEFQG